MGNKPLVKGLQVSYAEIEAMVTAQNKERYMNTLKELVQSGENDMFLVALAAYDKCPEEYLRILAGKENDILLLCKVLEHPQCPSDVFERLKKSKYPDVRERAEWYQQFKIIKESQRLHQ